MPAIGWPMTAGWPIPCINSPISRPQTSRAMIWDRKITSEGPCDPLSAANTNGWVGRWRRCSAACALRMRRNQADAGDEEWDHKQ
jgi:hypothetical protein